MLVVTNAASNKHVLFLSFDKGRKEGKGEKVKEKKEYLTAACLTTPNLKRTSTK